MKKNLSAYCSFYGSKTTVVYLLVVLSVIALVSISLSPTTALGQERSRGAAEKAETKKRTQGETWKRWAGHGRRRPSNKG
jgi:hypothetical protein